MSDKARKLLERAYNVLGELSYVILKDSGEYNLAGDIYEFLVEDSALTEKQNKSDPNSVALQSICRGDKDETL